MAITGTVVNGVVVWDGGTPPPDGTTVTAAVLKSPTDTAGVEPVSPLAASFLKFAGKAVGLPEDMADQHDHYLHGTPKR